MSVAVDLVSGFVECLLLVLAVSAVRAGRALYVLACVGLGVLLYARMTDGFLYWGLTAGPLHLSATAILASVGLVLAGLTVLLDLLFEVVAEAGLEAEPPV